MIDQGPPEQLVPILGTGKFCPDPGSGLNTIFLYLTNIVPCPVKKPVNTQFYRLPRKIC